MAATAHYVHFPETAAASANISALNDSTVPGIDHYYFLWANRCQNPPGSAPDCIGWNPRGNVVSPALPDGARTFFTSYQKANDCTFAQGVSDSNIYDIYQAFDNTEIQLWSGNRQGDIAASAQAQ